MDHPGQHRLFLADHARQVSQVNLVYLLLGVY